MKNIFKKAKNVVAEGAETDVVETVAETGKNRNKFIALGALGLAAVGTVVALVLKANKEDDDTEMWVPDTDEPIEVTDEMVEEIVD